MTGLKLVEELCRELKLDLKLCTYFLKEVLKIGGKDLRATPYVKMLLASMPGKTSDQLTKALEITKEKHSKMAQGTFLHPRYFIAVLKNTAIAEDNSYDLNQNLNWGKSI